MPPSETILPRRRTSTFRNKGFVVMGVLCMAMVVPLHATLSWEAAVEHGFSGDDVWIMWPLLGGMITFFYMLCFYPRIRLTPEGIELRDFVSRHFLPWKDVVTLNAEGRGRFLVEASDGTTATTLHYGGSLGGELIRYRHHRWAVRRVERWRERYAETSETVRGIEETEGFPTHVCLLVFGLTQLYVLVGLALHYLGS